jgi:ribose transport system ATP-binding protein
LIVVENITKRYPGVVALDKVSMELLPGKVNAIVGENGAGKSTLMKVLSGVTNEYDGKIIFNGEEVVFANIREAQARGVAIIHQELNLIPYLSIRENIFLGREILDRWGFLNKQAMRDKSATLLRRLKLAVDPETLIADLKVGQQQVVEIAKALLTDSEVIIMDEPTSAISDKEVEVLFEIINDLKKENKIIVYISHKLDELFRIADRYIVMRDGVSVESGDMKNMTQDRLIQKMVGREIQIIRKQEDSSKKDELLRVENLSLRHPEKKSEKVLKNISFQLGRGEIIGLFGLMGAGRTELMESLFGMHADRLSGNIFVGGKRSIFHSASDAIQSGIALVPEDRKKDGLVLELDVKTNISLTNLDKIERGALLSNKRETALAKKYIDELKIKTSSDKQKARNLSGGNQQKIVLAKWLARNPKILLLDEPTRGIDINAKNEIYRLMLNLTALGLGIIMASSELPEILAVSDKILVLSEGSLTADLPIRDASENALLKAAIPKTI